MPHSRFSDNEISKRGEEIYERDLRSIVETEANIGKIISIDIENGDYEIDSDVLAPALRLQAKHPDAAIYGKRIGFSTVFWGKLENPKGYGNYTEERDELFKDLSMEDIVKQIMLDNEKQIV